MPRIYTLTANTALDVMLTLEPFVLGANVLADDCQIFAGGKGVNVAKALASLQQPVSVHGFIGAQSRQHFYTLVSPYFQAQFIELPGASRTNITLSCPNIAQETHVRSSGYQLDPQACQTALDLLLSQIQAGDLLILAGSLPRGAASDWYKHLTEHCQQQGARVILDSSGLALAETIVAKPFLLKPNQQELADLFDEPLHTEQAVVNAAQSLVKQGITCVVVSRGAEGALLVTEEEVVQAHFRGQVHKPLTTIGCGDALVAGLAIALLRGDNWQNALALGVACGTANVFKLEPGCIDAHLVAEIMAQVNILAWP